MKILFLSRWLPYPPDNGSKIRIFNLIKQLSANHDVALIALADDTEESQATNSQMLEEFCSSVQVIPYQPFRPNSTRALVGLLSPTPRSLIDTQTQQAATAIANEFSRFKPTLVIASQLDMVPYALQLTGVPLLLEELELSTFLDATQRGRIRRARSVLTWLKLSGYLRRVLPRFAACTVVSDHELANVKSLLPDYKPVSVLSNAVDIRTYDGKFGAPQPDSLVFSGALTYRANYDAARYFLRDIYPSILARIPSVQLRITGNSPSAAIEALPRPAGLEFTGHVPDIRPLVAQSWVSVVPLRIGGGTRLKILESMALGTPVVATSKGAEGLHVTPGQDILIADDAAQFARCVVELLQSAELRERLAAAGRRLVESTYDWATVGCRLETLVVEAARRAA